MIAWKILVGLAWLAAIAVAISVSAAALLIVGALILLALILGWLASLFTTNNERKQL